jgi:hypothetical protein
MMGRWLQAAVIATLTATLGGAVSCGAADSVTEPVLHKQCAFYYGGGGVAEAPDGASACAAGVCNYQTQDCAAGKTCAPHVDATTSTIVPVCRAAGTAKKGEPCDDTLQPPDPRKQCGPRLLCAEGACRNVCCGGDWRACDPGEGCFHQANMLVGTKPNQETVYTTADLCFPVGTCDVLDPKACSDVKQTCRIVDSRPSVACTPSTTLQLGDPCSKANQCGAGQICVGSGDQAVNGGSVTEGTCRRLCRWACDGQPACGDGEGVCVHFDRDPAGVGECTPNFHGKPIIVDGGVLPSFFPTDGGTRPASDARPPVKRRPSDAGAD